jgi:hypothetical protein
MTPRVTPSRGWDPGAERERSERRWGRAPDRSFPAKEYFGRGGGLPQTPGKKVK